MTRSHSGRFINFCIALALNIPSLSLHIKPSCSSFLHISRIGAVIQRLPPGILFLNLALVLFVRVVPFTHSFLIKVPRNFALSVLALVIKVFSSDNSSLSFFRSSLASSFSFLAISLFPHIPISQSSAYLTYLILPVKSGLGIVEVTLLLSVISCFRFCMSRALLASLFPLGARPAIFLLSL